MNGVLEVLPKLSLEYAIQSFVAYFIFVYMSKSLAYKSLDVKYDIRDTPDFSFREFLVSFFSIDFWFSFYFKEQVEANSSIHSKKNNKAILVAKYNNLNLFTSVIIFFALPFILSESSVNYLLWIVMFRFASRLIEISYAFLKDVLYEKGSTTKLDKFMRIRLALKSYVEVFFLSAAMYTFWPNSLAPYSYNTLIQSFGVGTFTNISPVLTGTPLDFLVYIQVFSALSLIVMSLAVYISRDN